MSSPIISESLKQLCIRRLREIMNTQSQFVKVHAAEYLVWTGHLNNIKDIFLNEERLYGKSLPYGIGIWRVLAQATTNENERRKWVNCIQDVFLDIKSKHRNSAAESLAKLGVQFAPGHPEVVQEAIESDSISLSMYALWAASNRDANSLRKCNRDMFRLLKLGNADPLQRMLSAYIIRHINSLTRNDWEYLARLSLVEPDDSIAKPYMHSATIATASSDLMLSELFKKNKSELLKEAKSQKAGNRTEMAVVLSEKGTVSDMTVLISLLNGENPLKTINDNAEAQSAAAFAILKMASRFDAIRKN